MIKLARLPLRLWQFPIDRAASRGQSLQLALPRLIPTSTGHQTNGKLTWLVVRKWPMLSLTTFREGSLSQWLAQPPNPRCTLLTWMRATKIMLTTQSALTAQAPPTSPRRAFPLRRSPFTAPQAPVHAEPLSPSPAVESCQWAWTWLPSFSPCLPLALGDEYLWKSEPDATTWSYLSSY